MTNKQISEIYEIPLSTVHEWSKPTHNKHKVYLHLQNSSPYIPHKNHRLLHILNRNILNTQKYTIEEIETTLNSKTSNFANQRQKIIVSKFFKECDVEDLEKLIKEHGVSIKRVKKIYEESPERKLLGVQKVWNKRFRLKAIKTERVKKPFPALLLKTIKDRNLDV